MLKTKYLIGDRYKNNLEEEYTIIGYTDNNRERIIKFDSGYVKKVLTESIIKGNIRDYNTNTYYGVACLGMEDATKHYLYFRWFNMIGRCYNVEHCQYKSYGEKGIFVEEYLRNFKNYVEFVEGLPNIEKLKNNPKEWQIDKDAKYNGSYSRDSISIITTKENNEIENKSKRIPVYQYSLNKELINKFSSISEAERITGIHRGNIARNVRGESHTAGGYIWTNYLMQK